MNRIARTASRVALVGAAAAALSIAVAMPAAGHTGLLFTVVAGEGTQNLGTIDPVTAAITPLGDPTPSFNGLEIVNETAYGITGLRIDDDTTNFLLVTWDHSTGALLTQTPITLGVEGLITGVEGLDSLPDGTLLAYVYADVIEGEFPVSQIWVASIDPATGVATLLVELTALDAEQFYTDSLATNPITGVTYAFVDYDDGVPLVLVLDLVAGTYTGPTALTALAEDLGGGYVAGADFDPAGTLWFYYSVFGEEEPAVIASTTDAVDADLEAQTAADVEQNADLQNLTYDPYVAPQPQLAATGFPVLAFGAVGAALLGAGGIALVARRRRTA